MKPDQTDQRRRELQAEIATIGLILPGSLNVITNRCGKPTCRCHANPPQLHGPYLTWTRKVAGKTITRRLSTQQAERYRPWLENNHRLRALIAELEALTVQTTEHAEGWAK
jgi:hypothetical protein